MIELYNGDCLDILPKIISDVKNPVIVSDPPFNVGYHYNQYKDNKTEDEYYEWIGEIFSMCPSVVIHYPEPLFKLSFYMGIFPERVVS